MSSGVGVGGAFIATRELVGFGEMSILPLAVLLMFMIAVLYVIYSLQNSNNVKQKV